MNQSNSLWKLLTGFFSFFAVFFLLLSAGLVTGAHFGWTNNKSAGVLTIWFAVTTAIFSIVALGVANFRVSRRFDQAAAAAQALARGETLDTSPADEDELLFALQEISDYLHEKAVIAQQIAGGDLTGSVSLRSERDVLGEACQNMIERLRVSVQTAEKRERLERSIRRLLAEVSEVSAGDLTVKAEVSSEMTGAIAKSFNSMTASLRTLIGQVKDVTFQVGASAKAINETTAQLARGSEAQASQISRTTAAISTMAAQIQEVSRNAFLSAQVAGESLNNARYGTKAVQDNINAMNSIRQQVQQTAKRIKKLGERSQEIGQIVRLIDDLSERTSLLALNASLQASTAGEAGRGFALVAVEVERLAERSNHLTQQIAALTQTIQSETKEVVASMEETIHEVVVGSTLADKAGQTLTEIEQVSSRLAELIHSICESARHQAESSEDIAQAMDNISKITGLVEAGAKRAAESVGMLVELSDELRGAVAPFKLPDEGRSHRLATEPNVFLN